MFITALAILDITDAKRSLAHSALPHAPVVQERTRRRK